MGIIIVWLSWVNHHKWPVLKSSKSSQSRADIFTSTHTTVSLSLFFFLILYIYIHTCIYIYVFMYIYMYVFINIYIYHFYSLAPQGILIAEIKCRNVRKHRLSSKAIQSRHVQVSLCCLFNLYLNRIYTLT